jgi:hypothetical protein
MTAFAFIPPLMIIEFPVMNCGQSVAPRQMSTPLQEGVSGPGNRRDRVKE